jgi:hypothetical protein
LFESLSSDRKEAIADLPDSDDQLFEPPLPEKVKQQGWPISGGSFLGSFLSLPEKFKP